MNHLDAAVEKYKNCVYGTTRMIPFEMSNIIEPVHQSNNIYNTKFQVGGYDRVIDKRVLYSKGYTRNWSIELFKTNKINPTDEVTYTLEDENTQRIEGNFYARDFLGKVFNFKFYNKTLETMETFH